MVPDYAISERKKEIVPVSEAVLKSRFSQGTLLGLKQELLGINRKTNDEQTARGLSNAQFRALEDAMKARRKDPSESFSKFSPEASAFLHAAFRHLDNRYPKNFPSFPPGITLEANEFEKIAKDAKGIESRRTFTISSGAGERLDMKFSRDLSAAEKSKLRSELTKWKQSPEPSELARAFFRANTFPSSVRLHGTDKEIDPVDVMSRSRLRGEARDFVYNKLSLDRSSIATLERALSRSAKDPKFDSFSYLSKTIPDANKRDIVEIAHSAISSSKIAKGSYEAGPGTIAAITDSLKERERQLTAFRKPLNAQDWHIASISTPKGAYYLRIPKSFMKEGTFRDIVKNRKMPDEVALVFGLNYGKDLMVAKYENGSLRDLKPDERKFFDSLKYSELKIAMVETKPREKKEGKETKVAMR